jgi:osmotically-inducible protein OsmY
MTTSTESRIVSHRNQVSSTQDDVEAELNARLHVSQHAALRNVTCRIDDDTVVLYGRVPSYYLKQLAQVKATTVPGVECVDNRIEVAVS